jgi:hypothetical protein
VKALSLTQPWASLAACGAKKIETRSWPTKYRGPLAIHASKGFPKEARRFTTEQVCYNAMRYHGRSLSEVDDYEPAYPLGVVLAIGFLMDCVPVETLHNEHDAMERAFGDYTPGRWAWKLEQMHMVSEPIPAKGKLGLWEFGYEYESIYESVYKEKMCEPK